MIVVYAYVPSPATGQLTELLKLLTHLGLMISRLGKMDPPKKWTGTLEAAISLIESGSDSANYTFLESANFSLSMTIILRRDPEGGYSQVSFLCPNRNRVDLVSQAVLDTLSPFLCIRGTLGLGKDQSWDVLHQSPDCPALLRRIAPTSQPTIHGSGTEKGTT